MNELVNLLFVSEVVLGQVVDGKSVLNVEFDGEYPEKD